MRYFIKKRLTMVPSHSVGISMGSSPSSRTTATHSVILALSKQLHRSQNSRALSAARIAAALHSLSHLSKKLITWLTHWFNRQHDTTHGHHRVSNLDQLADRLLCKSQQCTCCQMLPSGFDCIRWRLYRLLVVPWENIYDYGSHEFECRLKYEFYYAYFT